MITLSQVPGKWREVLRAVTPTLGTGYIAGGALRDADHGVEPKDLDLFVFNPNVPADWVLVDGMDFNKPGYENMTGVDTGRVYTVPGLDLPVNVLALTAPISLIGLIKGFDFGLCQIGFGTTTGLVRTQAYWNDHQHKTFTFQPQAGLTPEKAEYEAARSLVRWERIKERYPAPWGLVGLHEPIKYDFTDLDDEIPF